MDRIEAGPIAECEREVVVDYRPSHLEAAPKDLQYLGSVTLEIRQ